MFWSFYNEYCVQGSGDINTGYGLAPGQLELNSSTLNFYNGCSITHPTPAGYITAQQTLYIYNFGVSQWTACNIGPSIGNGNNTYTMYTDWTPTEPCGAGYYYKDGQHYYYDTYYGYLGGEAHTNYIYVS